MSSFENSYEKSYETTDTSGSVDGIRGAVGEGCKGVVELHSSSVVSEKRKMESGKIKGRDGEQANEPPGAGAHEKPNAEAERSGKTRTVPGSVRVKRITAWHIHCPVCGAFLERLLTNSSGIVDCKRCHQPIVVISDCGKILTYRLDEPDIDAAVERMSIYQKRLQCLNRSVQDQSDVSNETVGYQEAVDE